MTTRYKNFSTHVPMRIWTMPSRNVFRMELPSPTLSTPTEWKFDTKISSIPEWQLYRSDGGKSEVYVFNTCVLPPFPRGCLFLSMQQNEEFPYNTKICMLTDFVDVSKEQFFVYTYSIRNTLPLYMWMTLDMFNELSCQIYINPDTDNEDQRRAIQSQYLSYVIYPLLSVEPYWGATHEYLCVPCTKDDGRYRRRFATLQACEADTYPRVKNRHTWVENGNQPLYKFMQWWKGIPSDRKVRSLLFS